MSINIISPLVEIRKSIREDEKQGWLKSAIQGRGSSYKELIISGLKSRGGGRDLAEISILISYKAKLY